MKFDTVETCQNKIDKMRYLLKQLKDASNIQFPIEEDETKQFSHYTVNQIQDTVKILEDEINKLQDNLNEFNLRMAMMQATDNVLLKSLDEIDKELQDFHISAYKYDKLDEIRNRIKHELETRENNKEREHKEMEDIER